MKKTLITILAFLIVTMPIMGQYPAYARTAYLRATAVGSENCSSHNNACADWSTANTYGKGSGDPKLLIYAGDTITGQCTPDVDTTTIGTYYGGEGTETEVTDATSLAAAGDYGYLTHSGGSTILITTADVDDLLIHYVDITNTSGGNMYCINSQSTTSNNHTVRGCNIHTSSGDGGIWFNYTTSPLVEDCTISVNGEVGIGFYGKNGATPQVNSGIVRDTTVDGNGSTGDNVVVHADTEGDREEAGDHWLFDNVDSTDSSEDNFDIGFVDDVEFVDCDSSLADEFGYNLSHGGSNFVLHDSTSTDDGTDTDGTEWGAIYIDDVNGAMVDPVVYNMRVSGNYRNGLILGAGDLGTVLAYNNTFAWTGSRADGQWAGLYTYIGFTGDVSFIGNIVTSWDDNSGTLVDLMRLGNAPDDYVGDVILDYNLYCREESGSCVASIFEIEGETDTTLAEVKANQGTTDDNSVQGDPLFTNVASDWTIQEGGAGIDNSMDLGDAYDVSLNDLDRDDHGEGWDIGANEFSDPAASNTARRQAGGSAGQY